jgi:hypothetical protein
MEFEAYSLEIYERVIEYAQEVCHWNVQLPFCCKETAGSKKSTGI